MWTYEQRTGHLSLNGILKGTGYSGHDAGVNNPALESVHDVGPIPRGKYVIGQFFDDPGGKGPTVAHLTPVDGTHTFGRGGFMIHGDNSAGNRSASHGCIILARFLRESVRDSGDADMEVL